MLTDYATNEQCIISQVEKAPQIMTRGYAKSLLQWAMEIACQGAEAMRRPRRNHTAALKGDETLAALAEKFDVHE